jgi:uncharacterized damage-inducible protein DinB
MQKEILSQLLGQNHKDCSYFCKNINAESIDFRLTEQTASVGFIYRHIGETANLIGQFFGYETTVEGTTIGQKDTGQQYDLETSRMYFEKGYNILEELIADTSDKEWLEEIETPWFGKISRIKLFSVLLFHNSHHCGQISSALLKGKSIEKSNQ